MTAKLEELVTIPVERSGVKTDFIRTRLNLFGSTAFNAEEKL